MMKIYTKKGDQGNTQLVSGTDVPKSHIRLETYGTVDELNSFLGLAVSFLNKNSHENAKYLSAKITAIQNNLFNLGSQLACDDQELSTKLPQVTPKQIQDMEHLIDELTLKLKPLKNFILPGGSELSSTFHICRTVCRRAERWAMRLHETDPLNIIFIQYLNRLSDLLFVLARYSNWMDQISEPEWKK